MGAGGTKPLPIRPYSIAVTRVEGEWLGRTVAGRHAFGPVLF
jgi:hypothetical protein